MVKNTTVNCLSVTKNSEDRCCAVSRLIKIADWTGVKRSNVVFIHGLSGHPYNTWQRANDGSTFWPSWLAEDVKGLSVYSLGYISPPTNWVGTAMPLLDEAAHALRVLLNSADLKTGPITFVCHSLGGLVAKSILRAAREQSGDREIADFYARVRQVVFIATPHTGAGKATLLEWLSWLSWPTASTRNLVANNPGLRDLNFGYRNLTESQAGELTHLVYYEMLDTLVGGIVAPASADPGLPNCLPTPIREDHITIAKPKHREDLVYAETKALIVKLAPEPAVFGELRIYPAEPFELEWSWKQLVPKFLRITAIGLLAWGVWIGVPLLRSAYVSITKSQDQIDETRKKAEAINNKIDSFGSQLDALALTTAREQGVPVETLRAILNEMGDTTQSKDAAEIGRRLTAKAIEYKALNARLNQLTDADPEVSHLRKSAAEELAKGHFSRADSNLAAAEVRDLASFGTLETLAQKKRLSAAESRANRALAAKLRANPDGFHQAAIHYGEAARIALAADPKIAREYDEEKGQTLLELGYEFGRNAMLLEALHHFRAMLSIVDRSREPLEWARGQSNLGRALGRLGARDSTTARLEEAVIAYRDALTERTRERVPLDWAETQGYLGHALGTLGARENGTMRLKEAVVAYREALKEQTKELVPLHWAATQTNLGNALQEIGGRERETAVLNEAILAYGEALKVQANEQAPLDWATTQNNLGNALYLLGELESGTARLDEAVIAYRKALKVRIRERVPLQWAVTHSNLGIALFALGERESGTSRLAEAVIAYREALKEQTQERVPFEWASTQHNLGTALHVLGARENGTARLSEAVIAYRAALKEWTSEATAHLHNNAQHNLSLCLALLETRGKAKD